MQEESVDRPDPEDLKKYGAKLKPTYSHFEEDLVRDGRWLFVYYLVGLCLNRRWPAVCVQFLLADMDHHYP